MKSTISTSINAIQNLLGNAFYANHEGATSLLLSSLSTDESQDFSSMSQQKMETIWECKCAESFNEHHAECDSDWYETQSSDVDMDTLFTQWGKKHDEARSKADLEKEHGEARANVAKLTPLIVKTELAPKSRSAA
ncbi:hypothetical protein KUL156_18560 [Alteromonas sp. KUL156]|nr:hypothetical protein KUL154_45020 [Alteromonas sp. KUL154]GFD99263.1 hypothetical protein KUL156_18560 [Alteromonas sp. KUL156]